MSDKEIEIFNHFAKRANLVQSHYLQFGSFQIREGVLSTLKKERALLTFSFRRKNCLA
jgi:hypothetical protein